LSSGVYRLSVFVFSLFINFFFQLYSCLLVYIHFMKVYFHSSLISFFDYIVVFWCIYTFCICIFTLHLFDFSAIYLSSGLYTFSVFVFSLFIKYIFQLYSCLLVYIHFLYLFTLHQFIYLLFSLFYFTECFPLALLALITHLPQLGIELATSMLRTQPTTTRPPIPLKTLYICAC
jgi:hypothetical protein